MSINEEMVLVWWLKDKRTSIVKINDANKEDRHTGCISQVKFGKQRYPARILEISRNQEVLKESEEQFFIQMYDEERKNDSQKRQIMPKRFFGSIPPENEVAVAIGKKNHLPPNLHEVKKNERKYVRKNLKCRNQAQIESDNLFLTKSKSKDVIDNKRKNCPKNLKTTETRQDAPFQVISQMDFIEKYNDEDDVESENSSIVENPSRNEQNKNQNEEIDDINREDNSHTRKEVNNGKNGEKYKRNTMLQNSSHNNTFHGVAFLEQYRGMIFMII